MDLSMLEHLSDEALRKEAARRQIAAADGMERTVLIDAIRRSAVSLPPRPVSPPPPAPEPVPRASTLGAARAMLGKVVGFARDALERRSTRPPPPAEPPREPEPIRTRTMAELLVSQGERARALAILEELAQDHPDDAALAARVVELEAQVSGERAKAQADARLADGGEGFIALCASGSSRAAAWAVDDRGLERARALLGADGVLTLRVVQVCARPDRTVARERDDRVVEARGVAALGSAPGARWVVSIGLAAGDGFVSIAHAADPA